MRTYLKVFFVIVIQLLCAATASATSFSFTPSVITNMQSTVNAKCVSSYTGAHSELLAGTGITNPFDWVGELRRNCTLVKQDGEKVAGKQGDTIRTNNADDFSYTTLLSAPRVENTRYCTWDKSSFWIANNTSLQLPDRLLAQGNASACGETTVFGGGGGGGEGLGSWEPDPFPGFGGNTVCDGGPSWSHVEDFRIVIVCGHAPKRE